MHKLTELIIDNEANQRTHHDKIITQFLEQVIKEPFAISDMMTFTKEDLRGLLGLSESEPKSPIYCACHKIKLHNCPNNQEFIKSMHEAKESEKWCEHLEKGKSFYNEHLDPFAIAFKGELWKFCPICGTPRPKEKSLAEKFQELDHILASNQKNAFDAEKYWQAMSEIAAEHFKQK